MNGQRLKHDPYPVYLGVTLDQTISHTEHLSRSAAKLKSRNNLIVKLTGTSWGASASTVRTSALALCYSVAEYCCPVWVRSSYTNLIDTELHRAMRLISGCLQSTQLSRLSVLSSRVREYVFFVFFQISKNMTFYVFFEMMYQKVVKSHQQKFSPQYVTKE